MYNLAILGANSHIGKSLIFNFSKTNEFSLYLFTTREKILNEFLDKNGILNASICNNYEDFHKNNLDIIINCIGIGTINKFQGEYYKYFTITEKFDNMIIEYLIKKPQTLYISIGSGAVYGGNFKEPVNFESKNCIKVNNILPEDYYSIVRINSEAKHRAFSNLNIVDIRIFSFFSRFIDVINDKYMITEIITCIKTKKKFITDSNNIIRDYIHHEDLFAFILKLVDIQRLNAAFDILSKKTIEKFELLNFFANQYGLEFEIMENFHFQSATGSKIRYYSTWEQTKTIGFKPKHSSLDTIRKEMNFLL